MHFLDIKHGLALSIGAPDGGECGNIDFPATYALFVCTDTLARNLVKCELHHLSLCGSEVCVRESGNSCRVRLCRSRPAQRCRATRWLAKPVGREAKTSFAAQLTQQKGKRLVSKNAS